MEDIRQNIEQRVISVLDEIRIYLNEDGGDVEFVNCDIDTGILNIRLTGNCESCPMSEMTLRAGIERYIKHKIPEITRIERIKSK